MYGRLPRFGLSAKGREQAEETGRFTGTRRVDALYSSPLLRARQTADIISQYHPHLRRRTAADLIEVRSSYQGQPNSILKPGFSFYDPVNHECDESMADVFSRMLAFLRMVLRRHQGERVVAVSHADPIVIMRLGLQSAPYTTESLHSEVYPARASVNQITIGPETPMQLEYFAPATQ